MDYEKSIELLSNQQSAQTPLGGVLRRFLSVQEMVQIIQQFQSENWISNGQVLWSGIPREKAQEWADRHQLQTLTTAMGPLMDEKHPECLKSKKNPRQWSRYVHGASAIFAWRIAQGEKVTLLSPPPPERFHPSGLSYYQLIEEPIIRGLLNQNSVQKIIITHPMIEETEDEESYYELWPNDRKEKWVERFGSRPYMVKWRQVGHSNDITELRNLMTSSEWHFFWSRQFEQFEKQKNKLPRLMSFGLSYPLLDHIRRENNAINGEKRIPQTAKSTSTVISPGNIHTEQKSVRRPRDETKAKRNLLNKARQEAIKKLKNEALAKRRACDKAQKKAAKSLKDEVREKRKTSHNIHQEAIRRIKDEVKAKRTSFKKAEKKAARKLNNEGKAKRKALETSQQEAAKKARNEQKEKRKALDKAYHEAVKRLKVEETAKSEAFDKTQQEVVKSLKDEKTTKKALETIQQKAEKRS